MPDDLPHRTSGLLNKLRGLGRIAIAYSGGVDSAFLLAAAVRALGAADTLAVTAVSESLGPSELAAAVEFAAWLGVPLVTPRTQELAHPGYRANGRSRCYFCKAEVLGAIIVIAADHGFANVATGTNADDALDRFRPGIRAADERNVLAPLRDAGFTKHDVRAVSRSWGLPTWDKPASPCLASRIAYGIEITPARLSRVFAAEEAVRRALDAEGIAVTDLRVRDLGAQVRVEVDAAAVEQAMSVPGLAAAVCGAGFSGARVTVVAYRPGALNREPGQARQGRQPGVPS